MTVVFLKGLKLLQQDFIKRGSPIDCHSVYTFVLMKYMSYFICLNQLECLTEWSALHTEASMPNSCDQECTSASVAMRVIASL